VDNNPSLANERRELHDGEDAWFCLLVNVRRAKRKTHTSRQHPSQMHLDSNFVSVEVEVVIALPGRGAIRTRRWIKWAESAAEVEIHEAG
jgi:hypothetical protein